MRSSAASRSISFTTPNGRFMVAATTFSRRSTWAASGWAKIVLTMATTDCCVRGTLAGTLRRLHPTALPGGSGKELGDRALQLQVRVADDELDAVMTSFTQALEELGPKVASSDSPRLMPST